MGTDLMIIPFVVMILLIGEEAAIGFRRGLLRNLFRFISLIFVALVSLPLATILANALVKGGI